MPDRRSHVFHYSTLYCAFGFCSCKVMSGFVNSTQFDVSFESVCIVCGFNIAGVFSTYFSSHFCSQECIVCVEHEIRLACSLSLVSRWHCQRHSNCHAWTWAPGGNCSFKVWGTNESEPADGFVSGPKLCDWALGKVCPLLVVTTKCEIYQVMPRFIQVVWTMRAIVRSEFSYIQIRWIWIETFSQSLNLNHFVESDSGPPKQVYC